MTVVAPTRSAAEVTVGETLPELAIPITRTLVVATAIASRDYQDVHHDPGLAVERGSKDVFMNILTSNGLVDRYVTSWAGPAAVVKKIRIRLGAPNHPGDTMVLTGSVVGVYGDLVEVAVRGENSLGAHVSGTVVVLLPSVSTGSTSGTGPTGSTSDSGSTGSTSGTGSNSGAQA